MCLPLPDDRCLRLGTDVSRGFGLCLLLAMSLMIGPLAGCANTDPPPGGMGGTGGASPVITVGCRNSVTAATSVLDWELTVSPTPIESGEPFTAALDGVALGNEFIEGERALEAAFSEGSMNAQDLRRRLQGIARIRADLRYVHLSAHLKTPPLLSEEQIRSYHRLRGYDVQDPCRSVPPGHDPEMWKRHNRCED